MGCRCLVRRTPAQCHRDGKACGVEAVWILGTWQSAVELGVVTVRRAQAELGHRDSRLPAAKYLALGLCHDTAGEIAGKRCQEFIRQRMDSPGKLCRDGGPALLVVGVGPEWQRLRHPLQGFSEHRSAKTKGRDSCVSLLVGFAPCLFVEPAVAPHQAWGARSRLTRATMVPIEQRHRTWERCTSTARR